MVGVNGVIDFFLHPTFAQLTSSTTSPSTISNPVTGRGNVLASSAGLAPSFGIVWAVSFAPPFAGRNVATLPDFEDTVFELWVEHTLSSGLVIVSQRFASKAENGILMWENLLPSSVIVDVFPNFELTLEWLIGI